MHDFIVKRAVDFVLDLLLHSLRAPATNARHFYSCFQACILPPNFLTGSLRTGKLHRCMGRHAARRAIAARAAAAISHGLARRRYGTCRGDFAAREREPRARAH